MKPTYLYIALGVASTTAILLFVDWKLGTQSEEDRRIPIVHLHPYHAKADYELNIATQLKPPSPNVPSKHGQKQEMINLQNSDEIETFILGEEPSYIYNSEEVDETAKPAQNLQAVCHQIARTHPQLIPCRNTTFQLDLIIHHDGSLIEWHVKDHPNPICEAVLLSFISTIQQWEPARYQGKTVTQLVSVHIHFH